MCNFWETYADVSQRFRISIQIKERKLVDAKCVGDFLISFVKGGV